MPATTLNAGPSRARRTITGRRYPRGAAPPVLVEIRRGGIVEGRHRGHVVQVGLDGRVERAVGDPEVVTTLRSAVKPFALVALIESGAADAFQLSARELAVMTASHTGEDMHVRTLQGVFRRSALTQSLLACGSANAPADQATASRLARDGEDPGPIRHMCSGFHAASLLLSRHRGWSLEDYWQPEHPSQLAVREVVGRVFRRKSDSLRTTIDSCGLLTYAFPLVDIARAFALLADPRGAVRGDGGAGWADLAPAVERVRDAMRSAPEMVGGTRDAIDTAVVKASAGAVVAKGGAEGLRGIAVLPDARGRGTPAAGVAVKIEDGDQGGRANRAVTVESLAQLGVLDRQALARLTDYHRPALLDPRGEQVGEAMPGFEFAPISERL